MKKRNHIFWMLALTMVAAFVFVGCGNNNDGNTASNGPTTGAGTTGGVMDDIGDAIGDVGDAVGDAVKDLTDGYGYTEAHDYLLGKFAATNANGQYVVRNEKKELVEYGDGKKGYKFELYDSSKGTDEKVGDFYIDEKDKTVHKMNGETKKVEEYKF